MFKKGKPLKFNPENDIHVPKTKMGAERPNEITELPEQFKLQAPDLPKSVIRMPEFPALPQNGIKPFTPPPIGGSMS